MAKVAVAGSVIFGAAYATWIATDGLGTGRALVAVSDLGSLLAALCAAAFSFIAGRRSTGRARRTWTLIGCGWSLWAIGNAVWSFYELGLGREAPVPSVADFFYLGAVPFLLAGFLQVRSRRTRAGTVRLVADGLAVSLALAAAAWRFLLLPLASGAEATSTETILLWAYPISDLALLVALCLALRGNFGRQESVVLHVLAAGIIPFLVVDTAFVFGALGGGYSSGHLVDFGWQFGLQMAGIAAILQAAWRPAYVSEDLNGVGSRIWATLLGAVVIPFIAGTAIVVEFTGGINRDVVFLTLAATGAVMAAVRQSVVISENVGLNGELLAARERLRGRVAAVTHEAALAEKKFQSLTESSKDAIITTGVDESILSMNPAACGLYEVALDDVVGQHFGVLFWPQTRAANVEAIRQSLREDPFSRRPLEFQRLRGDGTRIPVQVALSSWEDGGGIYVGAIIRDMSEQKRQEEELRQLADVDGLTGLLNQRRFEQEIERALAAEGTHAALLFVDIDHFKGVNDNFGHRTGDDLLRGFAELLRKAFPSEAIIARRSGDEFAVLLIGEATAGAITRANRLGEAVRAYSVESHGQRISVTASVGVAIFPEHAHNAEALLVRADQAMYASKERRDRATLFSWSEGDETGLSLQRPWEQRIREALASDGFVFEYQPIRDRDGVVRQWEALIRLRGEDGDLVLPWNFLGVAERSGLIHHIDRWVVRRAVETIAAYRSRGVEVALEVNLGAAALNDRELLPLIRSEISSAGIGAGQLIFEITETAAIADLDLAHDFITELRALGCRFALDDFGVGFSSLYALRKLPVDYLKIDGSFIRNLGDDVINQALVRSIVQMAAALGIQTIAEFVTSEDTLTILSRLGVDLMQGYHVGKPRRRPELDDVEPISIESRWKSAAA